MQTAIRILYKLLLFLYYDAFLCNEILAEWIPANVTTQLSCVFLLPVDYCYISYYTSIKSPDTDNAIINY